MERILNSDDKIKRAEEIYYRRKKGIPSAKFSRLEGENKNYLGSKILLQILLIVNLSIIIMCVQNRNYIFTEKFLNDIQMYNINLTKTVKQLIGIDNKETVEDNDYSPSEVEIQEDVESMLTEDIVPNDEGKTSSLNGMDEEVAKIKESVSFQKPIKDGTITSRFGARESIHKNVEGYHTGIDIGAAKRYTNLCFYIAG